MRVGSFIYKAGKIITATMLILWVLMAIPVTGPHSVGDVPVADSVYGLAASSIAPALSPAGFGNDHAAAALITGFVAKEIVVGSFALPLGQLQMGCLIWTVPPPTAASVDGPARHRGRVAVRHALGGNVAGPGQPPSPRRRRSCVPAP